MTRGGYQPVLPQAARLGVAPLNSTPGGLISARCNPYGHETGGPKQLEGGVYGPEYEGKYKWVCQNVAVVRARMVCTLAGHRGQEMNLCRPHAVEIQKRQSGLCPRCAWPPEALDRKQQIDRLQAELSVLYYTGRWHSPRAAAVRLAIEDAGNRMTELWQTGVIKKVGLVLQEVS